MKRLTFLFIMACILQACSPKTFYVFRHAEKEAQAPNMTSDVPLSAAGQARALALKEELKNKKINHIYSTNTIRTKSTAQPLSDAVGVAIQTYDHRDTGFVTRAKALPLGNVLIIGHSNTVDDIVNGFVPSAQLKDLPDTQYGDLFIIKKRGDKVKYSVKHIGN
jgi:phosphohistidine phosphatase SixA